MLLVVVVVVVVAQNESRCHLYNFDTSLQFPSAIDLEANAV
jgi:hypothetical protein